MIARNLGESARLGEVLSYLPRSVLGSLATSDKTVLSALTPAAQPSKALQGLMQQR